jgi:hypothetical protein
VLCWQNSCRRYRKFNCTCVDNTAAIHMVAVATGIFMAATPWSTWHSRLDFSGVQRTIILIAYIATSKNIADVMAKQSAGPASVSRLVGVWWRDWAGSTESILNKRRDYWHCRASDLSESRCDLPDMRRDLFDSVGTKSVSQAELCVYGPAG